MREIGGFIEAEKYEGEEFHVDAIDLNTGRNCLRYIIRARKIKKLLVPSLLCSVIIDVCEEEHVKYEYYSVDSFFRPVITREIAEDEYIYIINFYGQLNNEYLNKIVQKFSNIIIDNAQAFFQEPIKGVDTIYTCRKFFGVSDGAYLYTNKYIKEKIDKDYSYNRISFLLGRYELSAREFYSAYQENEHFLCSQGIKYMSEVTHNILSSLCYDKIIEKRTQNFKVLHRELEVINNIQVKLVEGPYMYPLLTKNGEYLRKRLQENKIYIPTLWPNVLTDERSDIKAVDYAKNILPLPCDQRYSKRDMREIVKLIFKFMED